ncbi:BON1-associated protein 2-like [Apium graveolens]|uniref:BON1-associated protein 2-like n=1 Tax=Apium graveolens TaxID=4045 RepID=UPI003D7A1A37
MEQSYSLEITIISCEGLRINRQKSVKKNTFVTVQTDSQNVNTTQLDVEGGSYPVWNEKLYVQMPMHVRFLNIDVQCKVSSFANKFIGRAKIPVSDFTGPYFPENYLHILSYRLRDDNMERNGIINFSIRMKAIGGHHNVLSYSNYQLPPRITPMAGKVSSYGMVTGLPVWNS